jgi:23S rRNA (cytidine1920-2'-O)/16S rRNA (cytidine1409-2'-O)-methyltransferase
MAKERVDKLLVDRGLAETRGRAQRLVMARMVFSGDAAVDKPGTRLAIDAPLEVRGEPHPFVSRGGAKLDAALAAFAIDVTDLVALDVGASTGGFTDCLLQRGARRVYAVDVGYGQLAWKLRNDPRVVSRERTNVRALARADFPEPIDLVVIDASFISLRLILPVVRGVLHADLRVCALLKPQIQFWQGRVGKGGVVRDASIHAEVLDEMQATARELGFTVDGVVASPLLGPAGNREFFLALRTGSAAAPP